MTETAILEKSEKLKGIENYHIWSLKTKRNLRAESFWYITEEERKPETFPATMENESITEVVFNKRKALACRLIANSVSDDIVDLIQDHTDPAIIWKELKELYAAGDKPQKLMLKAQLNSLKMEEGGSVDEYLKKARELRNRLTAMGEKIPDSDLNGIVLNGLPLSYESMVMTLAHLDPDISFAQLSSKLLTEQNRREHRLALHGETEALTASFTNKASFHNNQQQRGRGRGRWGRAPPWWRMPSPWRRGPSRAPGRGHPGGRNQSWRPPTAGRITTSRSTIIYYNCGKGGHIARDCRHPPVQEQGGNEYAYSAEVFGAYTSDPHYYDPTYYDYNPWYLDSGATSHVASEVNKLDYPVSQNSIESTVKTGGGESHPVHGTGTSTLNTSFGEIKLQNVRYVPSLKKNLA